MGYVNMYKNMAQKEKNQGWIDMGCGHAYVFKAEIVRKLKDSNIEYCDHHGYRLSAVPIEFFKK